MIPSQPPTQEERIALHKLRLIAQEYRKASPEMPTQQQLILLTIAENPGSTLTEIGQRTGMLIAAVSRHIGALGPYRPAKKIGLELITDGYADDDRRKKVVHLTAKGCAVVDSLIHLVKTP